MKKDYKNILIIKMSSLGDIIHALPSLYVLRKAYPKSRITWAVHPSFEAFFRESHGLTKSIWWIGNGYGSCHT